MAENVNVSENKVSKGAKIWAGIKEWFRKQVVSLKRAPQRIPLVFTVIVTLLWLIWLFTFSAAVSLTQAVSGTGITIFINTLVSILVIPLFLNAFPKRKGTNYVFFALLFVFLAGIIACDVVYYIQESAYLNDPSHATQEFLDNNPCLNRSLTLAIVHMVLIGISIVLLATLPLYKKLILKINTKKVVEENKLTEEIDTSEEV